MAAFNPPPGVHPGFYDLQRYQTNHGLHLLLTILTMGLWGILVWPWVGLYNVIMYDNAVQQLHRHHCRVVNRR